MNIHFYKYQGTGNDFVMIDDRNLGFPEDNAALIELLCHRRFGIGADGLILIRHHSSADFEMIYFNADGFRGSMCGNGGRCAVHFAHFLGIFQGQTRFMAYDGLHEASINEGVVALGMADVFEVKELTEAYFLNTGSPHHVVEVKDLANYDVFGEGKKIRYASDYAPKGTNVNFIAFDETHLHIRTYERGVEDETLSCGTGVTAAAITAYLRGQKPPIHVISRGGNLTVDFLESNGNFTHIVLSGKAEQVFEGTYQVKYL